MHTIAIISEKISLNSLFFKVSLALFSVKLKYLTKSFRRGFSQLGVEVLIVERVTKNGLLK